MHYAGEVTYDIHGFLQKNMDHASDSVTQTIQQMNILGSVSSVNGSAAENN